MIKSILKFSLTLTVSSVILLLFFCKKESESITEDKIPCKLTIYSDTSIAVSSGDSATGFIGYGFDAKGFCDATAVRERIVNIELNRFL